VASARFRVGDLLGAGAVGVWFRQQRSRTGPVIGRAMASPFDVWPAPDVASGSLPFRATRES